MGPFKVHFPFLLLLCNRDDVSSAVSVTAVSQVDVSTGTR